MLGVSYSKSLVWSIVAMFCHLNYVVARPCVAGFVLLSGTLLCSCYGTIYVWLMFNVVVLCLSHLAHISCYFGDYGWAVLKSAMAPL